MPPPSPSDSPLNPPGVGPTLPPAGSAAPLTPDGRRTSPRVVVAEHESIIRMDLAEMLQAHGYQVVASTGSFAEAVTLTLFLQPDLLVLDRALITAAGDDPIDRIQRTQFPLAVVETCYAADGIPRGQRSASRVYLPKPFAEEDLTRAAELAIAPPRSVRDAAATRAAPPGDFPFGGSDERENRTHARRHSAARPAQAAAGSTR
jgi:CheY-like chemotaxis protein